MHSNSSKSRGKALHRSWLSQFGAFCFAFAFTLASGVSGSPPAQASPRTANDHTGATLASSSGREAENSSDRRSDTQVRRTRNPQLFVEPGIIEELAGGGTADLLIHFGNLPDFERFYKLDWETRGRAVYDTMDAIRRATQGPVIDELRSRGVQFKSFWVGNLMEVYGADLATFNEIVTFESVHSVVFKPEHVLIQPEEPFVDLQFVPQGITVEPNIDWVKAPLAWNQGIRGQGVVVGLNDSPPRYTHQSLVGAYRGSLGGGVFDHQYNWFDPVNGTSAPVGQSHGTHVLGLMLGNDGSRATGMAPDAEWLACGGCAGTGCPGVMACLNWFLAPTDQTGANPDPDRRPHVVNNSWGDCGTTYQTAYEPVWDTMYASGVMPFFANGNASNCGRPNHPGLNTVGNPARGGRVIGVGSTTATGGNYASHSMWGPTDNPNPGSPTSFDHFGYPDVKPNVSAPGQGVISASSSNDTAFVSNTGTSMASPHVTGMAALLISACPTLAGNHQAIGSILMSTANHVPYDGGTSPDSPDMPDGANHPNYGSGWGEIDAEAAVAAALAFCGPTGTLAGTVTDADTAQTLQGVRVSIPNASPPPADFNTNTSAGGGYSRVLPEGNYQITFSKFGYLSQTFPVVIEDEGEVVLDVALQAADLVPVSGRVSDAQTGWGLHAEIGFPGAPIDPVYSDPLTGEFSVNLPEQGEYEATIRALVPGYLPESTTISTASLLGAGEDIALQVDELACAAPGYEAVGFTFEGFEGTAFPPPGWTTVKTAGGGDTPPRDWQRTTGASNSGEASALRIWSENAAGNQIDWLISPQIDFSQFETLSFFEFTDDAVFYGRNDVMISEGSCNPADSQFESLQEVQGDETWRLIEVDLSGRNGSGCIAFRYQGQFAHFWLVDDVRFASKGAACVAPTGALLFGQVIDANTEDGLNGAAVEIVGLSSHTTAASPDPTYGGGVFYAYLPGEPLPDEIFSDGFEDGGDADRLAGTGSRTWNLSASLDPYYPDEETVQAQPGANVSAVLALTAGRLTVEPAVLVQTTQFQQQSSRNLALVNDGSASVAFEVEVETGVVPVVEADFEGSVPPAGWTVSSLGGTAACVWRRNDELGRPNYAGGDGFSAVADSDLCGSGTTMDTVLVSPVVDFSALTNPKIEFVLSFRALGASRLDLDVSTNGGSTWTTVQTWNANTSATGPGTPQSVSLAAHAGSDNGRIRFRYVSPGWNWWTQVDQIRIGGDPPQWLSVTPGLGIFNAPLDGTGELLSVGFDATQVPGPGTYSGTIRLANDTPYDGGLVEVPVTFDVSPAPGQSRLQGSISGLGYCDADSNPLSGASVTVIGQNNTFGLSTDENGAYGLWIDTSEAPLTIEVTATDHVSQTAAGVALGSQQTATRDFDLRLDAPCGSASPSSLSTTQDPNTTTVVQTVLRNDGAAQLDWSEGVGSTNVLVIEQVDNANNGIVSSRFLGLSPPTGAYSAEDFEFGGGGISAIRVDGFRSGGGSIGLTATELGFFLYPDDGGQPAGHPEDGGGTEAWSFVAAPNNPAFSIGPDSRITLNAVQANGGAAPQLPPGRYWIVAYATVPGTVSSVRWNWFATAEGQATGFEAKIITPGAAFDGAFPDWTSIADEVDPVYVGLGFRVDAQVSCSSVARPVGGSGSVAADDVSILNIEVNTAGVVPGSYVETVCLETNDANASPIFVNVEVEVTAPASFGTLQGTVTSSGYCDLESDPLAGANVEVAGTNFTFNVGTDGNGFYSIDVDSLDGPYTVTATAAAHLQSQSTGVAVGPGGTTDEGLELRLDAPCASAGAASLSATAASGSATQVDLDIVNVGAASFDWTIAFEEAAALLGGGSVDVVQDGGFETGSPNAAWEEGSTTFGTPLCTADICGTGGGTGARSGNWWTWFGGAENLEIGFVAQNVTIPPASSAELRFWLEIPVANVPGTLEVRLGDDVVFSAAHTDAGSYGNYTEVVVDVLAYADGVERELRFTSQTDGEFDEVTNFFVDDVSLAVVAGGLCVGPAGVPWLSANPAAGTTAGDDADTVSVAFDASTLTQGSYEASLCLNTSDAQNPLIVIPVEFEVTEGTPLPSVGYAFGGFDALTEDEEGIVSVNVQAANIDPATPVRYALTLLDGNGDPLVGQGFDYCIDGEDCEDREAIPATDANGEAFFGPASGVPASATGILDVGGATSFFAITMAAGEYELAVQLLDVTDTGDPMELGAAGSVGFEVAEEGAGDGVVVDISGQDSPNIACNVANASLMPSVSAFVGENAEIQTLAWDTILETFGGSWASEAIWLITNTAVTRGIFLSATTQGSPTSAGGDPFSGEIDLVEEVLDFALDADGVIQIRFCESFLDGFNPNATWLEPSTITVNPALGLRPASENSTFVVAPLSAGEFGSDR